MVFANILHELIRNNFNNLYFAKTIPSLFKVLKGNRAY